MSLPTNTPKITSQPATPKAKEVARTLQLLLKPFTTSIKAIHRNGAICILYSTNDHSTFDKKVDELMQHSLLSQRMFNNEIEPENARYLNHIASGLPVNLHAAK